VRRWRKVGVIILSLSFFFRTQCRVIPRELWRRVDELRRCSSSSSSFCCCCCWWTSRDEGRRRDIVLISQRSYAFSRICC
jgi:hypothetical protein